MMMALKSPLMPSPNNNLMSAFSPYTDSPSSPRPFRSPIISSMPSEHSGLLYPPPQSSSLASSPSDSLDPSPIAPSSNGTDTTDIEDSDLAEPEEEEEPEPERGPLPKGSPRPGEVDLRLDTKNVAIHVQRPSSDEDEQPNSVIHAPQAFEAFHARRSPPSVRRFTPTPSQRSDVTAFSSEQEEQNHIPSPVSPPPISTTVPPARDWSETPRAQTRSEAEAVSKDHERSKIGPRSRSLEDIPEGQDTDTADDQTPSDQTILFENTAEHLQDTADDVAALKLALGECWTLCNTLEGLRSSHRKRLFSHDGKGDTPEQAWKSCWKLCQKLYDTRDEDFAAQVRPTLDLCRDFCQSLFEVRQRENDVADSVLRVSFELNNHLYNTHDRNLPGAFRERTLDFYITLCHRLMKQRRRLSAETDSLLRACWSLAEMLFSLRQNQREGKPADEELLGSAVQACWELCDLFREGWAQVKPLTPRPSQTTFAQAFQQAKQTERAAATTAAVATIAVTAAAAAAAAAAASASANANANAMEADSMPEDSAEESEDEEFGRLNPETPTTIFEDTQQVSPDEASVPNILVLGPDQTSDTRTQAQRQKWSSSSSTLSGYSQSSGTTTSSTSTIINPSEDPRLTCLKLLIVKAAMDSGFQRGSSMTLATFVKSIPSNSFGHAPWEMQLLENYKKLVASDPDFRSPGPSRRATASDIGQAVRWMVSTGQYGWLKDLFRLVFGFHVDEGDTRSKVTIQS